MVGARSAIALAMASLVAVGSAAEVGEAGVDMVGGKGERNTKS